MTECNLLLFFFLNSIHWPYHCQFAWSTNLLSSLRILGPLAARLKERREAQHLPEKKKNSQLSIRASTTSCRHRWAGYDGEVPEWWPPAQPAQRPRPLAIANQPASRRFAAQTQKQCLTVTETVWNALRSLMVPQLTLWYSMASWVSSIMRSTSSIDITWQGTGHPGHK